MRKIVTFGVFDLLHYGHINLFMNCKVIGDYLTVAVQTDKCVSINKPNCLLVFNEQQRAKYVSAIKYVDSVIFYDQVDESIKNIEFDVLVVGPDQNNEHFQKAMKYAIKHKKEIVVLPRTDNVSSTLLRKIYSKEQ